MGVINVHIELDITSKEASVLRTALAGYIYTVESDEQRGAAKKIYDTIAAQERARRRALEKK